MTTTLQDLEYRPHARAAGQRAPGRAHRDLILDTARTIRTGPLRIYRNFATAATTSMTEVNYVLDQYKRPICTFSFPVKH